MLNRNKRGALRLTLTSTSLVSHRKGIKRNHRDSSVALSIDAINKDIRTADSWCRGRFCCKFDLLLFNKRRTVSSNQVQRTVISGYRKVGSVTVLINGDRNNTCTNWRTKVKLSLNDAGCTADKPDRRGLVANHKVRARSRCTRPVIT